MEIDELIASYYSKQLTEQDIRAIDDMKGFSIL